MSRKAEFKDGKLVYRDMTKKEEAELENQAKSAKSDPVLTEEERLKQLESRIEQLEKLIQQEKK